MTADLEILFQDEHLVAVNKPALMHTERRRDDETDSLATLFCNKFSEPAKLSERWEDAGLLQRLDFETSGVVFAALSSAARDGFLKQNKSGKITKVYVACLEGILDQRTVVDNFIGSPYRRAKKVRVYTDTPRKKDRAAPARTEVEPLTALSEINATLARCIISSGSRHQVRAHCSSIGFPLLGDSLYGSEKKLQLPQNDQSPDSYLPGDLPFFLHAISVKCTHPVSGSPLHVQSPLPGYGVHLGALLNLD